MRQLSRFSLLLLLMILQKLVTVSPPTSGARSRTKFVKAERRRKRQRKRILNGYPVSHECCLHCTWAIYIASCLFVETPKDPGIPNNFPFKDQVLAEVSEQRRAVSFGTICLHYALRSLLRTPRRSKGKEKKEGLCVPRRGEENHLLAV